MGLLLAMLEEGYSDMTATSNVGGGLTVIGLLLAMLEEAYGDRTATSNVRGGLQL